MDTIDTRKTERKKFKKWKLRVQKRLPSIVSVFYKYNHWHYSDHVQLGRIIKDINDPYYSLVGDDFKPTDSTNEMACQVILEITVEDLFKKISLISKKEGVNQNDC